MSIVIDCDSHFMPKDIFDDVDPRFEERAPKVWTDAVGRVAITFPDREATLSHYQRWGYTNSFKFSRPRSGMSDPEARIEAMDRFGVDMGVLGHNGTIFSDRVEPDLYTSVCRSYNNAIGRLLERYPGRFIGLAVLPMQKPNRAVDELERAVKELGLHAPLLQTNIDGRNLDEPEFWPVYAKAEELNVPLYLHGSRMNTILGLERLWKYHFDNALGFLYEGSLAIASFICGGVLDLFPRLRIGLFETGCGYLPYLMDRLDEVYDRTSLLPQAIKKRPHEYLNHFWLSANVASEQEMMCTVIQRYGAERIMMAVDFPHTVGGAGDESPIDCVKQNPGLTQEHKDRILGLNAAELFAIPVDSAGNAVSQLSRARVR